MKDKKGSFYLVLLILLSVRADLRAKCQKKPAEPIYNRVFNLHGMQGFRGSNPLRSIKFIHDNNRLSLLL